MSNTIFKKRHTTYNNAAWDSTLTVLRPKVGKSYVVRLLPHETLCTAVHFVESKTKTGKAGFYLSCLKYDHLNDEVNEDADCPCCESEYEEVGLVQYYYYLSVINRATEDHVTLRATPALLQVLETVACDGELAYDPETGCDLTIVSAEENDRVSWKVFRGAPQPLGSDERVIADPSYASVYRPDTRSSVLESLNRSGFRG